MVDDLEITISVVKVRLEAILEHAKRVGIHASD
jgi:hypothetical protein